MSNFGAADSIYRNGKFDLSLNAIMILGYRSGTAFRGNGKRVECQQCRFYPRKIVKFSILRIDSVCTNSYLQNFETPIIK